MKPRLLNLAAGVSLLLAIVIIALWVRSYWRHEVVQRRWNTSTELRIWLVESFYGELGIESHHNPNKRGPVASRYDYFDFGVPPGSPRLRECLPFPPVNLRHYTLGRSSDDVRQFEVAYWLLLAPTLVLPAIVLVRHRHRRRRYRESNNLCPTCGYDLRAHAAGDRCPECGTSIQSTRGSCATQS